MDGLSGSSSGGSKNNEGGPSSGSKIAMSSSKSSTISTSSSSSKDSSSGLNKDTKMKTVEEKDPYMMDLAEDMDETPTTGSLYGNKKESLIGSKDKDRIREDSNISSFKRSISGPDSFGGSVRDKDNDSLSRAKPNKTKKKRKHGDKNHHYTKGFKNSKGHHVFGNGNASPCPDDMTEEDIVTHVIGKKTLYGKVWKLSSTPVSNTASVDGKDSAKKGTDCSRYRCYNYGIEYKPGDTVYIEGDSPEQPFYICCIQDIKYNKREAAELNIKWFYRTNEVPELVYQYLTQDRLREHNLFNKEIKRKLMAAKPKEIVATSTNSQSTLLATASEFGLPVPKRLDETMLRQRELFSSDISHTVSVAVLRGKCSVIQCEDVQDVRQFMPEKDTFFYTLSYNPETRRLGSTEGEIRVGESHQAKLPELKTGKKDKDKSDVAEKSNATENNDNKDASNSSQKSSSAKTIKGENNKSSDDGGESKKDGNKIQVKKEGNDGDYDEDDEEDDFDEEDDRVLEEITWQPGRIHDHDLLMYLRAGRSMAAFAAMCDAGGSAEEGFTAASRDSITANALMVLHECDYDAGKAVQTLLNTPFPPASAGDISRRWQEEDVKAFIKGLRVYGKNFFKIRVDFLPDKDTSELVEFYYLWKKTPGASGSLPRGRNRAHQYNVNGVNSGQPQAAALKRIKDGYNGGGKFGRSKSSRNEDDPTDVSSASDGEEIEAQYEALQKERKAELEKIKRNGTESGGKSADANEKKKSGPDSLTNGTKDGLPSSAIDGEMDMESGEEISPYYCRHCFTTSSKNWHHGGKEKLLLCADCRLYFKCYGEMPCLEPPMTHASSVEDVELTDEDEEVDITDTDLGNQAPIPDDGSIVGKDVKLDPELDLMKSSNLIKVPPPPINEEEGALNLNAIEQDSKLPGSHHSTNLFSPPSSTSAGINLQSSSANYHNLNNLMNSKDSKLTHPLGLNHGSSSLSSYRSGGIPGLPPPRAPLGPPGLIPPLHQLGFSKPGPPPLIDIVQKADQIAKQQREQQQLRQGDLGFPPKAHGSAPTHQRLGSQHHLSHHQPSSSGPPPAHAPPPAHGSMGSSNLISPLVGSLGASSKPGMAHSNSFQGSHHSSGQNPLGLHSSSMGGGSLLPPPPGLTSSSRPQSGLPPSSATQSHALQRGPPPSHQGIPAGPDPISRPRSTDIQVIGERFHNRGGPSPEPRQTNQPRVPSPPPKPDSSECHRSQSAIFTRCWNRGEGNSCARTDLFFKPVPDSKLARKREDRLRKATAEREEANFRAAHAHAVAQNEAAQKAAVQAAAMAGRMGDPFTDPFAAANAAAIHRMTGRITPNSPATGPPGGAPRPSPFGPGHPLHSAAAAAELERLDRDRRSIEHSEAMRLQSIAQSLGGSHGSGHPGSSGPSAHHPPTSRMSPFGPPTGHGSAFPPTPSPGAPPSHTPPGGAFPPGGPPGLQHLAAETRRLEEMASARQAAERQAIERQYAAQAHALATDPLVRLQMAGVNPEIPGAHSAAAMQAAAAMQNAQLSSYLSGLGAAGLSGGMRPPSAGLDPRLRSPADQMAAALRAAGPLGPPAGSSPSPFGLPPGLTPPVSLASSIAGMDAMLAQRALLERDHAIRAAHDSQLFQAAHAQHIQQQEEALKRLTRP